jgi:AcrR family transcriptional regulator
MTDTPQRPDRRAVRHAATKQEIVDAAWSLARERGLGGWSLRDVAEAVGMRAPSLYVYFASKNAVFDAMFADGCRALLDRVEPAAAEAEGRPPRDVLHIAATMFFEFCMADPARYQLLFLRTLPGFEPSEASYALAQEVLGRTVETFSDMGFGSPADIDLWTALTVGLVTQQLSNDPGGDRWRRLVPEVVDMFLASRPAPVQRGSAGTPAPTIEG